MTIMLKIIKSAPLKNKTGRKLLFGGPSVEIFFRFAHALRAFSDQIECLFNRKIFVHVLSGRINNYSIEHRFSINTCSSGYHLALDVSTFNHNE